MARSVDPRILELDIRSNESSSNIRGLTRDARLFASLLCRIIVICIPLFYSGLRSSTLSDYCTILWFARPARRCRAKTAIPWRDVTGWLVGGCGGGWSREALGCERDSGESRGGEQSWYESGYHWFQVKLIFGRDPKFGGGGGGRGGLFLVL